MKIKSPIGFLALWSAFLAGASCAVVRSALATPPDPEPFEPDSDPCLYARETDILECMPDIDWEVCDCEFEPATPCCRGQLVSGGVLVRRLWVWGVGTGFKQSDWEYGHRATVYRAPICPTDTFGDCMLADEESIYCGKGWAPNPDALPCW
jgi:hypothetical protein